MLVKLGGVGIEFVIDSGSPINAITTGDWTRLREKKAELFQIRRKCNREFHAYATDVPLKVEATFKAKLDVGESKPRTVAEFFVIAGARQSLLNYRTSVSLEILKIGISINTITDNTTPTTPTPFAKFPDVKIHLQVDPTVVPKQLAYYRVPAAVERLVEEKLDLMIQMEIIEKVYGPSQWISPMLVVPKGKSDIRICVDMREPNKAIRREHYPMPIIEVFLNKLRGAKIFSRIDIQSAFHHIELDEQSRELTTFMTSRGLMRYKRLMFGLNAAPEIFQRTMEAILKGLEGIIVFVDDIVIFGKTLVEHDVNLKLLMERLASNNATLNVDKCRYRSKDIEVLGFHVNEKGIRPAESKVRTIREFREPKSVSEVRSFLGLVQFVGQFIPNLASRTEPLRKMIRGETCTFGNEQRLAFNDLREELIGNVKRLGYFDPKDETEVYADASPWGIGAALVQKAEGVSRVITYVSKSLTETERRFPKTQREALAVVWAVERLYFYLFGLKFTLFTDHKTLEYIFKGKHQNGKRACTRAEGRALRLQPYNFEIKYIPGESNIADPLSRLSQSKDDAYDEESEHFLCAIEEVLPALSMELIAEETKEDKELQSVIEALRTNQWPLPLLGYEIVKKELGVIRGALVRDDRIILPVDLRQVALKIAHRGHPGEVMMKRILRERTWWPGLDRDVTEYLRHCLGCTVTAAENRPEPMKRRELPDYAWQHIAIDFLEVHECKTTFLVVVDCYSRYLTMKSMSKTAVDNTIEKLEEIFRV